LKNLLKEYIKKENFKEIIYIILILIGLYSIGWGLMSLMHIDKTKSDVITSQTLIKDELLNAYRIKDKLISKLVKNDKEIISRQDKIIINQCKIIINQELLIKKLKDIIELKTIKEN